MACKMRSVGLVCLFAISTPLFAQHAVDLRNMYERVFAVVPIIGSGTQADPQRPMYAPRPSDLTPGSRTGILAFTSLTSDDGKFALVEFVAADRNAFQQILADPNVKSFLKGRDRLEDVLVVFKKYKKDFDVTRFGVRMP